MKTNKGERIVYILEYLKKNTDDENSVTIKDIIKYLSDKYGFDTSVLTIRRDISRIQESGFEIREYKTAHNTSNYSLISSSFTFNEIRFLVDSVSINKFLSINQKQELFKKFECMCTNEKVRKLISRIQINDVMPINLNLLENLRIIHEIIADKCKIEFEYGKYDIDKNMHYYKKKRDMIPAKVIYFNERFYLKCIDENDGSIRTYRIDRMKEIKPGNKYKKKIKLPEPKGTVIDMFEPVCFKKVKLKVKRFLLDDMLEQFGNNACVLKTQLPKNSDSVIISANIGISQSFYNWIMKYGADMEIISPPEIREEFIKSLKKVSDIYSKNN